MNWVIGDMSTLGAWVFSPDYPPPAKVEDGYVYANGDLTGTSANLTNLEVEIDVTNTKVL